jgi:hemerythrin-like metal-binding protein
MEWSLSFSVNVQEIDNQHKVLISIINEVVKMVKYQDYNFNGLYEIIVRLDQYITEHFQYEEQLMLEQDYPELEQHVKEHNQFRYDLGKFNILDVEQPKNVIESWLVYLMNWLSIHIMNTDKRLGEYLNQKSIS